MLLEKLDLEQDEEILKVVRKHWFVIVSQLVGISLGSLIPIILFTAFLNLPSAFNGFSINLEQYSSQVAFFISSWLLLSTLSAFTIWTHYYLDLWIITDRRVIAIDQIGFFKRNVAIFRLERLQDIEFSVKGLLETFLNFGTLSAQTAGHMEANFSSTGMPNPDQLQALIQKAMDARLTDLNNKPNLSGE